MAGVVTGIHCIQGPPTPEKHEVPIRSGSARQHERSPSLKVWFIGHAIYFSFKHSKHECLLYATQMLFVYAEK